LPRQPLGGNRERVRSQGAKSPNAREGIHPLKIFSVDVFYDGLWITSLQTLARRNGIAGEHK
jgi:hypothetical protein